MEKKTIRSGAPFVCLGAAVLLVALVLGIGSFFSYMLAEAARMGIDVTLVTQLPSYAVKQYNPETKSTKSRSVLKLETYYNTALKTDCYDKYAPGKKVSDFLL